MIKKISALLAIPKVVLEVLKDSAHRIQRAQLLMVASSLAYTTILSIIPILAVSFAVFQSFGGMEKLYEGIEPFILSYLAEGTSAEVIQTLRNFVRNTHSGVVGLSGLIGLIFTSTSMLSSAEKAINRAWEIPVTRGFFKRFSSYWLLISLGPLALAVGLGIASSLQFPLWKLFPSGSGSFLLETAFFFCIYQWVPQDQVLWPCSLTSATITAGLWNLARIVYVYYAHHVVAYHKIYGSLAAVPIILLWIYILWTILLSGAALTVAIQKRSSGT